LTYAQLSQLVQNFLENSEAGFVANIPYIVQQAESRISNEVRVINQRKGATGTVSTATITAPSDFVEPLYLMVNSVSLQQREKSFLRTVYGDTIGATESYALDYLAPNTTIKIAPVPTTTVNYELSYIGIPESIVTAGTTWVSTNFPEVLLYGSLLEGYIYNKGEQDMLAIFQARFDTALTALRRSAEGLALKDEYRDPPERVEAVS